MENELLMTIVYLMIAFILIIVLMIIKSNMDQENY